MKKGAYIVSKDENPQVVMLASGSEVSTLMAGAELLRAEGIRLQIVTFLKSLTEIIGFSS